MFQHPFSYTNDDRTTEDEIVTIQESVGHINLAIKSGVVVTSRAHELIAQAAEALHQAGDEFEAPA